ncbi:MAG: DUF5671 domain-containing protein [Candidatus Margulisbacteria bacterium]|nr:DUF5671 domain-containing protein [Candidatus Margulisiibacteriota bacterium]
MKNHNPKYAFYYILSLVALIFVAISSALIVFQIIDKSVFDALAYYGSYSNQSALRFGISALLISAPIFFLCVNSINKGLKKGEIDKDSPLRNWLTYFILAVSAVVILGSLVGIINAFLSGEMTLKSILQLLTVILIAAIVFSYYLYDIRRDKILKKDKIMKIFFFSSVLLVIIIFISSWFFVESPKVARERKIDEKVMSNIHSLESYINSYYEKEEKLPEDLSELNSVAEIINFNQFLVNPVSGEKIEYKKIGEKEFELCANFRTDSYESQRNEVYPVYVGDGSKVYVKGWNCFKGNLWAEEKFMEKR